MTDSEPGQIMPYAGPLSKTLDVGITWWRPKETGPEKGNYREAKGDVGTVTSPSTTPG